MAMSTINFDKLHEKLNDKPRTYFVNSAQLVSSILNDAVECIDSLPLNGGVCDAYDMSNLLHDINEMDLKVSIARFQTNADNPWVTFGYLWMNWRGCPAFVEEVNGGDAAMHYEKRGIVIELMASGTDLSYKMLEI